MKYETDKVFIKGPDGEFYKIQAGGRYGTKSFFYNYKNCLEKLRSKQGLKIIYIYETHRIFTFNELRRRIWISKLQRIIHGTQVIPKLKWYNYYEFYIKFSDGEKITLYMYNIYYDYKPDQNNDHGYISVSRKYKNANQYHLEGMSKFQESLYL